MNTSSIKSSSLGRIQDSTKNALNRKDNPLDQKQAVENSGAQLKQAKGANRAEILSSLKNAGKGEKPQKDFENASPKVNEYLKMISRFENKVKLDQIEEKDLERVIKALEEKILSMNTQQKNRLKNIELFRKSGVENLKNMKETLLELFENKSTRDTFFEFLKSPEFVTILMNEQEQLKGYSPPTAKGPAPLNNNPGKPAAEPKMPGRV